MKKSKITALVNLNLTKEEAQEWINMLEEKEHMDWKEVVEKHMLNPEKIATKRIVCYKNSDGTLEYHHYVDGSRADSIYAIQVGPTPSNSSQNIPYYLMKTVDEAKNVTISEAMAFEKDGWEMILTEEICYIYNRLDQDDDDLLKALYDCGVNYESLDVFKTWYSDTMPNKCKYKFNVRLFKPITGIKISD